MSTGAERGWGYLRSSPKWHYFDKTTAMSACGKWMRLGSMNDLEDANDDSADNCKACQRKVQAMRSHAAANEAQP